MNRWMRTHPLGVAAGVVVVLAVLFLISPVALEQEALAPANEGARTYFGGADSVGQSFAPLPGLREVRMPVGRRDQEVRSPFILHLRKEYFGEDIRTAAVFQPAPETEEVTFRFSAILNPPPRLLWVLEAPHGPNRAYWVYREQDASAYPEGTALVKGRQVLGNFAFLQVGSQPKLVTLGLQISSDMHTWEKQSLAAWVVGAVFFLLFAPWFRGLMIPVWGWVGLLIAVSVIFHVWFARQLPLITDEGAYLQDAAQTSWTFWPLRDFLTKGLVFVLLLKLWRVVTPDTLVGWRLFSAMSWAGVVAGTTLLARRLKLPGSVQIVTAGLLALLPGVISVTTPLLLQVTSTLFVVLAMLAVLKGAQERKLPFIVLGALLMAAGYLTRASTGAAGVAGAAAVWVFSQGSWQERLRAAATYVGVGLLAITLTGGLAVLTMGPHKAAVLLNVEAFMVGRLQVAQEQAEPPIRWATQGAQMLWRGGSWLLAGLVALPVLFAWRRPCWVRVLVLGAAAALFANVAYHLADMGYLLAGVYLTTRMTMLTIVFGVPLALLVYSFLAPNKAPSGILAWQMVVVCGMWLGALGVLYRSWGIFRPHYIVEFLPPLCLLGAVALSAGWRLLFGRRAAQAIIAGLFVASWWQGTSLLMTRPVSGTVAPEAMWAVGKLIQREVPPGEEIFTAQPAVTVASGHPIVAGYSHPGWMLYSRLQRVPDGLRSVYFAGADEITAWLAHEVDFVVTDPRTNEVYFDAYPRRQEILESQFELIGEVHNDPTEEPFRLYRRR